MKSGEANMRFEGFEPACADLTDSFFKEFVTKHGLVTAVKTLLEDSRVTAGRRFVGSVATMCRISTCSEIREAIALLIKRGEWPKVVSRLVECIYLAKDFGDPEEFDTALKFLLNLPWY
ncbi:MAG: hypothetical protein ACP5QG_02990, partial [candidate division WOR-3 bacterium]